MINASSLSSQIVVVDANFALEAEQAIDDLCDPEIQLIPLTRDLCHAALSWASKFQHARAYDSVYLALAEVDLPDG